MVQKKGVKVVVGFLFTKIHVNASIPNMTKFSLAIFAQFSKTGQNFQGGGTLGKDGIGEQLLNREGVGNTRCGGGSMYPMGFFGLHHTLDSNDLGAV